MNNNGQLGVNSTDTMRNYPSSTADVDNALLGKKVNSSAMGSMHTVLLTTDGLLIGYGYNVRTFKHTNDKVYGQLGRNTTYVTVLYPSVIAMNVSVRAIATGDLFTAALGSDGLVYTFGSNPYGECK